MSGDKPYSEIIFFLGAGASIDAGFVDVIGLKDRFLKWLESESKADSLSICNEILKTLESWKAKGIDQANDVDIEIFLEVVEKIQNKEEDPFSEFYENNTLRIERNPVYRSIIKQRTLSKDIKRFVKTYFNRSDMCIDYLQHLRNFLQADRSLQIFSTNYDICIEQFCNKHGIHFVDTFDPTLNTKNGHNKQDADLILYKLHGSTTWYRTEQGDYIMSTAEEVRDIHGKPVVPLILYPGRKFEFFGPPFYNLVDLTMALRRAKYAIIVGYSFKDPHIAKIFDLAARENKDLILFLISPSACDIYIKKLEAIKDPEIMHGYTYRGFADGFDKQVASNLEGRVIPLPYKFARIFPLLKAYTEKLDQARKMDRELSATKQDGQYRIQEWRNCLKLYVECEYMTRASNILQEIGLEVLISGDWNLIFEVNFQGLVNALSCNDPLLIKKWKEHLLKVSELFAVDKFSFDPMIENNIMLDAISNIPIKNFAKSLENAIWVTSEKLSIINLDDRTGNIKKLHTKIVQLRKYLEPWLKGKLTYDEYYNMRKDKFPYDIENLRGQILEYCRQGHENQHIRELVNNIEKMELQKIYGGDVLTI